MTRPQQYSVHVFPLNTSTSPLKQVQSVVTNRTIITQNLDRLANFHLVIELRPVAGLVSGSENSSSGREPSRIPAPRNGRAVTRSFYLVVPVVTDEVIIWNSAIVGSLDSRWSNRLRRSDPALKRCNDKSVRKESVTISLQPWYSDLRPDPDQKYIKNLAGWLHIRKRTSSLHCIDFTRSQL